MTPTPRGRRACGFTLIELLTVIAIVAVLMSLLFAAIGGAMEKAKRTQARNDIRQLVAAINAYNEEYGTLPVTKAQTGTQVTYRTDNSDLLYTLRAVPQGANADNALNPRGIVFIDVPNAKNPSHPQGGISKGIWFDPWGRQPGKPESGVYHVRLDAAYQGYVNDPYPGSYAGGSKPIVRTGAIAWSLAKGGLQTYELRDQVISW
jgi:prepilin-type N-terminal cleavage/methylation domain-containing protein